MVRSRLEVRKAVIGSRMACSVRMNQRARFRPCSELGKRLSNSVASAGRTGMDCGSYLASNH